MAGRSLFLKFYLICTFFILFIGLYGRVTGQNDPESGRKCQVTFGESYHNYLPGTTMRMRVIFKNNSPDAVKISQELMVLDSAGIKAWNTVINLELLPNGSITVPLIVPIPGYTGTYTLTTSDSPGGNNENVPSFPFNVAEPAKSARLKQILVHTPDNEEALNGFLKAWDIKAPTVSWGQVLLLGKKSRYLYAAGDREIIQLVDRSLNREMSVIFLDFGPTGNGNEGNPPKMALPFNITVSFLQVSAPEQSFVLKPDYKELTFGFKTNEVKNWNGSYGVTVPATDLRFDGKEVKINAMVTTGNNPYRFPVLELLPESGKGKVYLCQLLTDGRLDESAIPPRNKSDLPAYDPLAVQFLLNLISATVGDNLLK